jgi:hypothetical protein
MVQNGLGKMFDPIPKTNRALRAGCVAHALEILPSNHKTLSSNLSIMKNIMKPERDNYFVNI